MGLLPGAPRGSKYILVVDDYFTKWKEAYPLNVEANSVAWVLTSCVDLRCLSLSTQTKEGTSSLP